MEEIRLHVIGRPRLEVDGRILPLGRRMPEQLLCYLACKGGFASNNDLLESLWPGRRNDRDMSNLNRAVSDTRIFLRDVTGIEDRYNFLPPAKYGGLTLTNVKIDWDELTNLIDKLDPLDAGAGCDQTVAIETHYKKLLQKNDLLEGCSWNWIQPFRKQLDQIKQRLSGDRQLLHARNVILPDKRSWLVPLEENEFFTGREAETSLLRTKLGHHGNSNRRKAVAIVGEGGMGKTDLAVKYCHLFREDYNHVFWLNCESRAHLQSDLAKAYLDYSGRERNFDDEGRLEIARAVSMRDLLRGLEKILLILDNADDPEALIAADQDSCKEGGYDTSLFTPIMKLTKADRIVTSRAGFWGDLADPTPLSSLDVKESALLYLKRAFNDPHKGRLEDFAFRDQEVALKIAEEVGGLTLAIDQAGVVTRRDGWTPEEYLANFSARFDYLVRTRPLVDRHELAVLATLEKSLEAVRKKCPQANELIRWCAYLPADDIPCELFTLSTGVVRDSICGVSFEECLHAARDQSLLHYDSNKKALSIHRHVQQVIRFIDSGDLNGNPPRYADLADAAISVMPGNSPAEWLECERHTNVWRHLGWNGPSSPPVIQVLQRLVIHGIEAWGGMHVRDDASLAVTKAESWDKQSLEAARSNFLRAKLLHLQGRPEEGLPHALEARRIFDSTFGPRSTETLDSMEILGATLLLLERKDEAIKLYEESVSIAESTPALGPERVVLHRRNLACALWSLRDDRRALEILETVLADRERILEPDHADTLDARHLYANALAQLGRFAEAELIHRENLKKRIEKHGEFHGTTLVSRQNLGSILLAQGHFQAACKEFQTVIDARSSELFNGHPDALWTKHKLALTYWEMGRREEAIALEQEVLDNAKQHLGPNQHVRIHAEETLAKWNPQMESESGSLDPV